jgi:hypothetical protein
LTASAKPSRTCWPSAVAGPDNADLEFFLCDGLAGRDAQENRKSGQLQLLFHDFSLIGGHVQPKSTPTRIQAFKTEAYSDDGYCRKQSGRRPKPSR